MSIYSPEKTGYTKSMSLTMKRISSVLLIMGCLMQLTGLAQSYLPEKNSSKMKVKPAIGLKAYAFNLKDVQLLDGSPFRRAMDADAGYMLALKPDRLLYRFCKNAGLPPKDSIYGGWESEGVSGHTLGHYLSACAMMYASTNNKAFKDRVDYMVSELARCQVARKT